MINNYKELYMQYCSAVGKKLNYSGLTKKEDIEKDIVAFTEWLYGHANDTAKYGAFLTKVIEGFKEKPALEINKGFYDSLSRTNNNIDVLPTYDYSMDLGGKTLMFGYDSSKKIVEPCIYNNSKIRNLNFLDYEMLLSHNPYSYVIDDVHKALSLIHKQGNFAVCFGVFGKETDCDKKKKLALLNEFADTLNDEYKISYETDNGLYFSSVNSKKKVLEKVKIK